MFSVKFENFFWHDFKRDPIFQYFNFLFLATVCSPCQKSTFGVTHCPLNSNTCNVSSFITTPANQLENEIVVMDKFSGRLSEHTGGT